MSAVYASKMAPAAPVAAGNTLSDDTDDADDADDEQMDEEEMRGESSLQLPANTPCTTSATPGSSVAPASALGPSGGISVVATSVASLTRRPPSFSTRNCI